MNPDVPWCSILHQDDLVPTCMVLVYREEDPELVFREETYANGWVQVVTTCRTCGSSEVWVEEE